MYRLIPSPTVSEPQPSRLGRAAGLAAVIALSLAGCAGVIAVGYYLPVTSAKSYWFISRSSGVVAYMLITLGVLWGLVQSGGLFRSRIAPALSLGMHSYLNWLGLGLAALHGIILVGDGYIQIDLARVFTPFISSYRPIPVGLGIVAFYLMLLLSLSFSARSHLGQKNFRLLHYGSFGVFVMVTLHGLYAGTDSVALALLYGVSATAVAGLTALRVIEARRKPRRMAAAVIPATAAGRPSVEPRAQRS